MPPQLHHNEYKDQCFYCRRHFSNPALPVIHNSTSTRTMDHVIALSKGGRNGKINTVYACKHCNTMKGGKTLEEFIAFIENHITERRVFKSLNVALLCVVLANTIKLNEKIKKKPYRYVKPTSANDNVPVLRGENS